VFFVYKVFFAWRVLECERAGARARPMWEKARTKPPDAVFSRGTPPPTVFGARGPFLGRDEDVGGEDMLPSLPYTFCENPAESGVLPATAGLVGPAIHRVVSAPEDSAGLAPMRTSAGRSAANLQCSQRCLR
jgi:hypothetical protein